MPRSARWKDDRNPGPLGALMRHAYGIHIEPFPTNTVIEERTHDVPSFGFASVCVWQRAEPLLQGNCLHIGNAIASLTRQNPFVEIALVGDLRLPSFAAIWPPAPFSGSVR